jgi:iron complex transport system substrate-binding protein
MAPESFDGIYTQIEQLGATIGRVGEAAELVGQMQTDIDAVIADLPMLDTPMTYYHELDNTYFSVTSDTFIGAVYSQAGLENIADDAGDLGPYPQLSAEFILEADPDLIFLACTKYCGETAETVAARPGWDVASAVVNGGVIEMDDDIVSRWGPRVVDFLESVGDAVNAQASVNTG